MEDPEQEACSRDFSRDPLQRIRGRGEGGLNLRPKTLAVLRQLMRRTGRVVSRQELLEAVWGDTKVNEAALKVCIHEIRVALGNEATTPQFIETLPRQGYRFITPIAVAPL